MRKRIENMLSEILKEIIEHYRYLLWKKIDSFIVGYELNGLKTKLDDWYLALARYQEGELEEAERILKSIEF
ncbi:MAG: hypothetical protein J7L26_12700 [Candidatus Aminicenantes bacterium]|nr:hypothetical protein [Candidatus Aminicenantes bacterium]